MSDLLIFAEMAVKHVENAVPYGAPNRAEDISHVRAASDTTIWPALAPRDQSMMVARLNQAEVTRLMNGTIETSEQRMAELATLSKRWGVATCIGMSAVAFDYLKQKKAKARGLAVFGLQGCDHVLVVLGLNDTPPAVEPVRGILPPASWPAWAVVCDPWYHEWFSVRDWARKFPHIINYTLRDRPRPAPVNVQLVAFTS